MMDYTNKIVQGDNLKVMKEIPDKFVDLIYLDPPFFSQKNYDMPFGDKKSITIFQDNINSFKEKRIEEYRNLSDEEIPGYLKKNGFIAFKTYMQEPRTKLAEDKENKNDFWENRSGEGLLDYLWYMKARLQECKRVLKDTGSIYLHCDWHASHYLKILMDEIFSYDNFQNEIIWHYNRWTAQSKKYQNMHDIIFWYSKVKELKIYNLQYKEYSESSKLAHKERGYIQRGHYISKPNKNGVSADDVWDINFPSRSKERLGYPTQKPEALLERIIKASSNEGDIVLDPFCGCGTSVAVAAKLKRNFIGIDISPKGCNLMKKRLAKKGIYIYIDIVKFELEKSDIEEMEWFQFQQWSCDKLKCVSGGKGPDGGIDGEGKIKIKDKIIPLIVQSKHWKNSCGEKPVRNYVGVLNNKKTKYGIIVANSFTKSAIEQAKDYLKNKIVQIHLITSEELLKPNFDVNKTLGFDKLGYYVIEPDYAPWRRKTDDIRQFF